MGSAIGSAVVPLWYLLVLMGANAMSAVAAVWGRHGAGADYLAAVRQSECGEITIDTLGTQNPNRAANIVTWFAVWQSGLGEITIDTRGAQHPNRAANVVVLAFAALIHVVFPPDWPEKLVL